MKLVSYLLMAVSFFFGISGIFTVSSNKKDGVTLFIAALGLLYISRYINK